MVVFWDTTNDGREGEEAASGQPRSSDTDSAASDRENDGRTLFHLARLADWPTLISTLQSVTPEALRDQTYSLMDYDDNLLHIVSGNGDVPLEVIQAILDRAATSDDSESSMNLAAKRNYIQQTPLHVAVVNMPERTDIIECLYRACPASVQARDSQRLRPIDILTQKIIMMEEVIKYARSSSEKEDCKNMLSSLWDAVRVLVGAVGTPPTSDETLPVAPAFVVHACLRSKEVPFALTERAMKYNKEQLALPDANGDLPLHVVARIAPPVRPNGTAPTNDDEDEEDENDDDEGDFLDRVLSLNPEAAFHFNNMQQLPLEVGILAGRKWHSGIFDLLRANPAAIEELHLPLNIFPFVIELLTFHPGTTFQMLQSLPELVMTGSSQSKPSEIPSDTANR